MYVNVGTEKTFNLNLSEMISFFKHAPDRVLEINDPTTGQVFSISKKDKKYIIVHEEKKQK